MTATKHYRTPWSAYYEFPFKVETFDSGIEDHGVIPDDVRDFFVDAFSEKFDTSKHPNHFIAGRCTIELSKEDDGYWHLDSVQFYDKQITEATAAAEAKNISASDKP